MNMIHSNETTMKLTTGLHTLWNMSRGYRRYLLAHMLTGAVRITLSLAFVAVSKQIIDIATHQTTGKLTAWIALLISFMMMQLLLSALISRLHVSVSISLSNHLRNRLFDHVLKSRWHGREKLHSGDVLNRMQKDVDVVVSLLCTSFPAFFITLLQLSGASLYLVWLDARLAAVLLCIMPVVLLASKLYMQRMRRLTREIRSADSKVQSHLQENLQHRTLIAALERTSNVLGTLQFLQTDLKGLVMQRNSLSIFSSLMVQLGFSAGYVTAFTWGVYGLHSGAVTFGMLTAFLQLVSQVQRPVVDLSRQVPAFIHAVTSLERIEELSSLPLEEQGRAIQLSGPVGIRVQQLSFSYPDSHHPILHRFSHDFTPGSLTAVLGETGSGKSTLVRLILALLQPDEGHITLYSPDQQASASPLTRGNFVYVPQGNTLISGTIRSNLLLGNPDATEAQLTAALHTAAAEFVADLPQGLDTPCGEGGSGLSEGQAQRIAIARGLLRPGAVLLLDEPTSSLDAATEQLLLQRLSHSLQGKTLLVITHQERTARLCQSVLRIQRTASQETHSQPSTVPVCDEKFTPI